jgi:hypothetical protein
MHKTLTKRHWAQSSRLMHSVVHFLVWGMILPFSMNTAVLFWHLTQRRASHITYNHLFHEILLCFTLLQKVCASVQFEFLLKHEKLNFVETCQLPRFSLKTVKHDTADIPTSTGNLNASRHWHWFFTLVTWMGGQNNGHLPTILEHCYRCYGLTKCPSLNTVSSKW